MTIDDVNQLVDEILQVLNSSVDPSETELIDLAARHDDYVVEASKRLRQIEKLLNKGLRPEAIALAEQEPNLNEIVTSLDFPELEVWNDFLMQYEIQPVHELPVDIASELNDAYSVSVPLERLLERYRTQSLARAPLPERIDTLRQLAIEDIANTRWQSDVLKFENHRVTLLTKEFQNAVKAADLNVISDLAQEVSSRSWSVKIPGTLKAKIAEARSLLTRRKALKELEPLCHELSDAYSAFDKPKGFKLRQRFFALSELAEIDETNPLYDIASPALDWLNEEEAKANAEADFQAGKALLETALDGNPTLDELERIYHDATRHEHTLPEALERRLADRVAALKSADSRRRIATMSSIVAVCLVCIVGVVLVVRSVVFQRTVDGHVQQLANLTASAQKTGDLTPVDEYFAKIEADDVRLSQQPEILGLKEQLETIRHAESGRQAQLDQFIGNAQRLIADDLRWENLDTAATSLTEANQLARNESEKARVLNATGQVQQCRVQLQKRVDETFEADQKQLVDLIAALPKDSQTGYADVLKQLDEMERRQHVSSELKTALTALKSKVTQQQTMVTANLATARSLQKITKAAGQPEVYRQAIIEYTQSFPGTERSEDLLQVVKDDPPLWDTVEKWNLLRRRLANASLFSISATDAKTLVDDYTAFAESSPAYPGRMDVDSQIAAFRAIASRSSGELGTTAEQVDRMFAAKTISQSGLLETSRGEQYLLSGEPTVEGSGIRFTYFTTTTGTQTDDKTLGVSKVPGYVKVAGAWKSPQAKMTDQLLNVLQARIAEDFEGGIVFGIDQLLQFEDVDAILRLLLIEKLLKIGSDGSFFIQARAAPYLTGIAGAGVSRLTNWAVWDDARAQQERILAAKYLEQNGRQMSADLKEAIKDLKTAGALRPGPEMECVGWLHRDAAGNWVVALKGEMKVTDPVPLFALGVPVGGSSGKLYPVLTVEKDALGSLPAVFISDGQEGQPVFRESPSS